MIWLPGKLSAEQSPVDPRADQRDRKDDPGKSGADAGAGQQVVRERVAEEALEHAEDQQGSTDQPGPLARTAERAREEDTAHVDRHGGDEDQRRPVVQLTHEQAAANLERDVQRALERARHLQALHVREAAVVDDFLHRGVEEQRQVDPRHQQYDERVQPDFAEQERPVRRERLVELVPQPLRDAVALVDPVRGGTGGLQRAGVALRRCGQRAHEIRTLLRRTA